MFTYNYNHSNIDVQKSLTKTDQYSRFSKEHVNCRLKSVGLVIYK